MAIPWKNFHAQRTALFPFLLFSIFLMTGCGSNEDEFASLLTNAEDKELCIGDAIIGITTYNVGNDVLIGEDKRTYDQIKGLNLIPALIKQGYLAAKPEMIKVRTSIAPVPAYPATAKGKPVLSDQRGFCIGDRGNISVIEYIEDENTNAAKVTFTYDVLLNSLVEELGIKQALSNDLEMADIKATAIFIKTNNGWKLETARW